jgi:hypothetical protein
LQAVKWLVLLLACGCAALKPRPADPGLFLLKPADAGFSATLTQVVSVAKGVSASVDVMAVVEITPESVKLAALGPMGNRVLALEWDGQTLVEERDPSLPKDFPAQLILRDMMLAYWSQAAIQEALPTHWSLKFEKASRAFFKNGQEVIHIAFSGDPFKEPIDFEHKTLGYKLHIRQVESND